MRIMKLKKGKADTPQKGTAMSKRNYQVIATVHYDEFMTCRGTQYDVIKKHNDSFASVTAAVECAKSRVVFFTNWEKANLIKVEIIDKTTKEVIWSYQA